jgi:hypothetical protein
MSTPYPPEPWRLRGQLYGSLFLVPVSAIPADLPPGCRPIRLADVGLVGAVWVSYEPGGVLSYRELMTTLLVRRGWRLLPTITNIWVDSVTSRDGGRSLWGIPKGLASFTFDGANLAARDDEGPLATGSVHPWLALPGRWPMRLRIVQTLAGRAKLSPLRATASVAVSRASFDADPSGPLAFLSGRRPIVSFTLGDFRMRFGTLEASVSRWQATAG